MIAVPAAKPVLLPKPSAAEVKQIVRASIRRDDEQWEAVYPHIRRMYVVERRKLRYVIDKLEREHQFITTVQTLKKHLAQWGFYKNIRGQRSTKTKASPTASQSESDQSSSPAGEIVKIEFDANRSPYACSVPQRPSLSQHEAVSLELLTSVFEWSGCFLEKAASLPDEMLVNGRILLPERRALQFDAEEASFSFRIVANLLDRGQGLLAGRLARKAFQDMEGILDVEGPLFIWNLLETTWSMMRDGHTQLILMLLGHLLNLAKDRYATSHPLFRILGSIHMLLGLNKSYDTYGVRLATIQQAWSVNADMLFAPLDERLLLLYYRIIWDSDLIHLPSATLRAADKFYNSIKEKVPNVSEEMQYLEMMLHHKSIKAISDNNTSNLDFCPRPENYGAILRESLATIRELGDTEPDGTIYKFHALSGVLKSRMFKNEACGSLESSHFEHYANPAGLSSHHEQKVQRLHARTLAFINKIIMRDELRREEGELSAINRLSNVIALREFGQDPTSPQIISEMWHLEKLLIQCGRQVEADHIRRESFQKLEYRLREFPADTVR